MFFSWKHWLKRFESWQIGWSLPVFGLFVLACGAPPASIGLSVGQALPPGSPTQRADAANVTSHTLVVKHVSGAPLAQVELFPNLVNAAVRKMRNPTKRVPFNWTWRQQADRQAFLMEYEGAFRATGEVWTRQATLNIRGHLSGQTDSVLIVITAPDSTMPLDPQHLLLTPVVRSTPEPMTELISELAKDRRGYLLDARLKRRLLPQWVWVSTTAEAPRVTIDASWPTHFAVIDGKLLLYLRENDYANETAPFDVSLRWDWPTTHD